jgi:annexin A6
MFKGGLLPAPVIQPLRCEINHGKQIKIGPKTYIQIKTDITTAKIFFTTDNTKPDPFQNGRTGKFSTHKYVGPFRLQPGSRVVKAIITTRDSLRESAVATKFIEVSPEDTISKFQLPVDDYDVDDGEEDFYSDEEEYNQFQNNFPKNKSNGRSRKHSKRNDDSSSELAEFQGLLENPSNPINYSGTQINVWGLPTPDLGSYIAPKNNIAPPPKPIEAPRIPDEFDNLPDHLRKLFKQIKKAYERDSTFQSNVDYVIENGQLKDVNIAENYDAFIMNVRFPKFKPDPEPEEQIRERVERPKAPPVRPPVKPPARPQVKPKSPSPPPKKEEKKEVVQISKPKSPSPPPPPSPPTPPPEKTEAQKAKDLGIYIEEYQQMGTIVDAPNFNAEQDADALRKAVKGLGTKESVIIEIMGNRSNKQRLEVKNLYKTLFGRDLIDDLKGDTSGNFEKLLVALLMSPVEYDCMEIRKAVKGFGTDESALIEILTSRSNKRIKDICELYTKLYKKKVEDDVASDTSGNLKKLLMSLLQGNRPETNEIDLNLVEKDTDEIIKAGIKKFGTDEEKFNTIFSIRSYPHLRKMFEVYEQKTGKSMEDSIKSEMSGSVSKCYQALILNIRNKPGYFAKRIKKAVKGLTTDEHTLNRIIVSRSEVDTIQIKEEYKKIHKNTLEKDVGDDVSGNYGILLLLLLKDPSERTYDSIAAPSEPHVIEEVDEPVIEETPTVVPFDGFNANQDSERLRKAMKGFGTDEKTIIEILAKRSNEQRQQIKAAFQQMHGRDLVKDIKDELGGRFRDTVEGLLMKPAHFDASMFRKAMKGIGTSDSALIELLTTRSTQQITEAKEAYSTLFSRDLEKDLISDTSGHYRKTLVSLSTANRPTGNKVDKTQAKIDAKDLTEAGISKIGTDESKFLRILCSKSYAQIRATLDEYQNLNGHSLEEDIKKECSRDLEDIFVAISE